MSQHTPGPWVYESVSWVYGPKHPDSKHKSGRVCIAEVCSTHADKMDAEGKANAALIARAPTLLRERDELRAALVACAAALDPHLDRMLQQQGACGDTFRANARAEARAALSKVTP